MSRHFLDFPKVPFPKVKNKNVGKFYFQSHFGQERVLVKRSFTVLSSTRDISAVHVPLIVTKIWVYNFFTQHRFGVMGKHFFQLKLVE